MTMLHYLPISYIVLLWAYRLVLLLVGILALVRLCLKPAISIRWFCMLIISGALTEIGGYIQMRYTGNNLIWYTGYSILNLFCAVMYFFYSVKRLQYKSIGRALAYTVLLLGIANSIWLQPLPATNTNFIFFASALIICLSLFALTRMIIELEDLRLTLNIHFWIATAFVGYWFLMLLCCGLLYLDILPLHHKGLVIGITLALNNLVVYALFGLLLIRFNKLSQHD